MIVLEIHVEMANAWMGKLKKRSIFSKIYDFRYFINILESMNTNVFVILAGVDFLVMKIWFGFE